MRPLIMEMIYKYDFLSNFYDCKVTYDGITYRNSEAAFQAQKTKTKHERLRFANLPPQKAKSMGRGVELREDWEEIKFSSLFETSSA